jgi:hypothetical protein
MIQAYMSSRSLSGSAHPSRFQKGLPFLFKLFEFFCLLLVAYTTVQLQRPATTEANRRNNP